MMKPCDDCPLKGSGRTCIAVATNHRPLCRQVAKGHEGYIRLVMGERSVTRPVYPDRPHDGRLRVGFWCPVLNLGGAESWQLSLAKALDPSRVRLEGVAVLGDANPAMLDAHASLMPVGRGAGAARLLASRCDVIVQWAISSVDGLLSGLGRRPKVVAVSHSPEESPWAMQIYRDPRGIDEFIAVSELAIPPIPAEFRSKSKIIWNAVTPERLEPSRSREEMRRSWGVPSDSKVVGFIGRIEDDKDPAALARMIGHLPENFWAVVVGAGYDTSGMASGGRFRWVGGDPDAGSVIHAFDWLVVPSAYESFGLSLCEGLWCGVPTISTRVGVAKLVDGLTREIPHRPSGEELADTVLADASDPRGTADRVERAKAWARERLDPERFGREWTDYLLSVASITHPSVAEVRDLLDRMKECPHRTTEGCGCNGALCALGKGRDGKVGYQDCFACIKEMSNKSQTVSV